MDRTKWLDDWKFMSKIDTALLVLNSIILGVNIHEQDWIWVAVFSACVTFFAAKSVTDIDALIDLGKAGINLRQTIEDAMKKGGYIKNE